MAKITYRTILVVGDNHKEIARKYSADNPNNVNAYYKYERCQQHRLEVTGEEGDFSDPFPLKDGGKSYSAHFNDIDWDKIHKNEEKAYLNKRIWELIVENQDPKDETEKSLKDNLSEKFSYFTDNFKTKEEFINHSTSLWYWGFATEDNYVEINEEKTNDDEYVMNWCVNYFERFIKPLEKTNPLITIYETHSLD